jgi:hypothetical protein
MSTESTSPSSAELVEEISTWAVGVGIVTAALFPLALAMGGRSR